MVGLPRSGPSGALQSRTDVHELELQGAASDALSEQSDDEYLDALESLEDFTFVTGESQASVPWPEAPPSLTPAGREALGLRQAQGSFGSCDEHAEAEQQAVLPLSDDMHGEPAEAASPVVWPATPATPMTWPPTPVLEPWSFPAGFGAEESSKMWREWDLPRLLTERRHVEKKGTASSQEKRVAYAAKPRATSMDLSTSASSDTLGCTSASGSAHDEVSITSTRESQPVAEEELVPLTAAEVVEALAEVSAAFRQHQRRLRKDSGPRERQPVRRAATERQRLEHEAAAEWYHSIAMQRLPGQRVERPAAASRVQCLAGLYRCLAFSGIPILRGARGHKSHVPAVRR